MPTLPDDARRIGSRSADLGGQEALLYAFAE
jgi:hypothetical protein